MYPIVTVVLVVLVAALFVGCKYIRGQILDGPGMERDSADYSVEEPVDGDTFKIDSLKQERSEYK